MEYKKPQFGRTSTAVQVARDIRLDEKNVIITGANTGIGKETCRVLCSMGATVFMFCRDVQKANTAKTDIINELGEQFQEKLHVMSCDLGSLQAIRETCYEWKKLDIPLHILINNAGVMACARSTTVDGFETQFGTNYVGHFLLTCLLLPNLKQAGQARVINVSSYAHTMTPFKLDIAGKTDIYKDWFGEWKAYSMSKTANILFSAELDKRFKDEGIRSFSLHPGVISTELGRNNIAAYLWYHSLFAKLFHKTIPQGAATTVYAATAPELDGVGGSYLSNCEIVYPAGHAQNEQTAAALWEQSMKWVGLSFEDL